MNKLLKPTAVLLAALMLAGLLGACQSTAPAAPSGLPGETQMKEIAARLMPEETTIHQMQNGTLDSNYEDIIGTVSYSGMEMPYARVTDAAYPTWEALTTYYRSTLTENYMNNHYMSAYLLSAEEAKVGEPPMYLEFEGALGRNTAADGAGSVEYAPDTAVFSNVTETGFTAVMDSMDGYGSKGKSTVTFVMGADAIWRIDSVEDQWNS